MTVATDLLCDISGLAHGGAGVARIDGRVIFVSGALPGESVLVRITDDSRPSWWRGHVVDVVNPSPDRTPISCPAAAAGAGCCDLAFATAEGIRRAKATILSDAMTRIGHLEPPAGLVVEPIVGSQPVGGGKPVVAGELGHRWRIRARLGIGDDGATVGFRAAHSNAIVAQKCAALTSELTAALGELDSVDLRAGAELLAVHDDAGTVHLAEVEAPPKSKRPGGGRAGAQRRRAQRGPSGRLRMLRGAPVAHYAVDDRGWDLPLDVFWQAHRGAAQTYAQTVRTWLREWGPQATVWDLYGGAGVFAGAACDEGARAVHIVDTEAAALAAADTLFDRQTVQAHHSAVTPGILATLPGPDVVIADPPRSGAGNAVVDTICAAEPAAIVHIGCDPAAFARDVGRFVAAGYTVAEVRAIDAFPLTHHVEALALLTRS